MGKEMTFWLFIGMFQGIVSETRLFREEEQAIQAFNNFTGENYQSLVNDETKYCDFHNYNDKFSGSKVEELQVEA